MDRIPIRYKDKESKILYSIKHAYKDSNVLIVSYHNGDVKQYTGSYVYYLLPNLSRCSNEECNVLYQIESYIKYHNKPWNSLEINKF